MECEVCSTSEILKENQTDQVKFECENGHIWNEDYVDNGGYHKRPASYGVNIEDTLFPKEKILYKKILNEIENNKSLYAKSSPEKIIKMITDKIQADEKDVYKVFQKIHEFDKKN